MYQGAPVYRLPFTVYAVRRLQFFLELLSSEQLPVAPAARDPAPRRVRCGGDRALGG